MTRRSRSWGLAALGLLAAYASGCGAASRLSLGVRGHPESSSYEAPRLAGLATLRWRVELVVPVDLESRSRTRATPAVDVARGVVYVGGLDHGLHALRVSDGGELWRFHTLGPVEGTPVLDAGALYVGCNDGALYALDAITGRMRWRFATAAEVVHAPLVIGDSVYFVNADDTVFALNRATGEQRWRYRRDPPTGITGGGHAGLYKRGHALITGFSDGHVVALDPTDGTVTWDRDTSEDTENTTSANESHQAIDVDTTPVEVDGNLFAASYTAGLYALDPDGGGVRWRLDTLKDISALAEDGRHLYAVSATAGLLKLSPSDGSVVWARNLGSAALVRPMVVGALLFVSTGDAGLWAVRRSDGEPLQGLCPGGLYGQPAIVGRHLFVESNHSTVQAWVLGNDPE